MKITASFNVRNEQIFLPYAMLSMQHVADEYVVIDHASTDKTVEMVEKVRNIVSQPIVYEYVHADVGELYCKNRKWELATGDWVFLLDGDELFSYENIDLIVKQIPGVEGVGGRGLVLDMVEFMTFSTTCGKLFGEEGGYAGQRKRPRAVRRDCNFKCVGHSWRKNGFFIDNVWHREDKTWMRVPGFIYHYDRLKLSVKERIEKITTHLHSIKSHLTRDQIKQTYIFPSESRYHVNAFLKDKTYEFKGPQPEVFSEYKDVFYDLSTLEKNRENLVWCPEASGKMIEENFEK